MVHRNWQALRWAWGRIQLRSWPHCSTTCHRRRRGTDRMNRTDGRGRPHRPPSLPVRWTTPHRWRGRTRGQSIRGPRRSLLVSSERQHRWIFFTTNFMIQSRLPISASPEAPAGSNTRRRTPRLGVFRPQRGVQKEGNESELTRSDHHRCD